MQPSLLHCGCFIYVERQPTYIPLKSFHAHTTIIAGSSRTTLTQTFENPNTDKGLEELRYAFPLYDGVSVVKFTCHVGERVIQGQVFEKAKAKEVYEKAKDEGRLAGLLEQHSDAADVFEAKIGNVAAGETVKVEIEYLGELAHDAETDSVRFTIPTKISPRYGFLAMPGSSQIGAFAFNSRDGEKPFSVTVDAQMPDGSTIKSVQSPSHPISVQIGYSSKDASSGEPSFQKASASLSLGSVELDKDFIIQVAASKLGEPSAVLETHPTIPNQRAIMTTLVPKFNLTPGRPEIVFLCDRSGSMQNGQRIENLKSALQIFLKSLPVGVKFNICSFGRHFEFLWDRSQNYDQASLDKATAYVDTFSANFGGTHIYEPLEKAFEQRYKDMNLEVFLLTDGQIWDQDKLFKAINDHVAQTQGAIRLFTLGIGSDYSSSLVEGVARAGNGFSQSVAENEQMTKKVVRMLKASLMPHIKDYTLEIKYGSSPEDTQDTDDEDFEIIEKMTDCLNVGTESTESDTDKSAPEPEKKKPISLFNPASTDDDGDAVIPNAQKSAVAKYDHLPAVTTPKYLQAPCQLPPLFPFNRTTAYVLLSDDPPKGRQPRSVLLKGTSPDGPLELEIPITVIPEPGETIHQLAARKAMKELEEGRGWIFNAKNEQGTKLLKDEFDGRFPDMVEREGVRLGLKYQIAGKWCSFAAEEVTDGVSSQSNERDKNVSQLAMITAMFNESNAGDNGSTDGSQRTRRTGKGLGVGGQFRHRKVAGGSPMQAAGFAMPPPPPRFAAPTAAPGALLGGGMSAKMIPPPPPQGISDSIDFFGAAPSSTYCLQASTDSDQPAFGSAQASFGSAQASFGSAHPALGFGRAFGATKTGHTESEPQKPEDPLQSLAALQSFVGSWEWSDKLEQTLGTEKRAAEGAAKSGGAGEEIGESVLATACVVVYLQKKLADDKDSWEMISDKAVDWLNGEIGQEAATKLMEALGKLF